MLGLYYIQQNANIIHIYHRNNCKCQITSGQIQLTEVVNLRLLRLHINKRYNWKVYINELIKSLNHQLNIIKCLSSQEYNSNTKILIQITKTLILSKINNALPIYEQAKINSSIRYSRGAFPTLIINSLYAEDLLTT